MKYEKPEVVVIGSALACVQTANKPSPALSDSNSKQTATAYEADE